MVDLAYGDSGKGTIIDFLARRTGAHTVVRFNGGPQAGHNVVTPEGRHHTFAQFGSADLIPAVKTLLSQHMLIEPYAMFNEARHPEELGVSGPMERLLIDAPVRSSPLPIRQPTGFVSWLAARPLTELAEWGLGRQWPINSSDPELTLRFEDLFDRTRLRGKLQLAVELKRERLADAMKSLQCHAAAAASLRTLQDPSWIEAAVDVYTALCRRVTRVDSDSVNQILRKPGIILFKEQLAGRIAR